MCAEGRRPICQDTGIVNVFVKAGLGVRWDTSRSLQEIVDEGVRRGYLQPDNRLRPSIVADPLFARKNTGDNTPAVVHVELVSGDKVEVTVAAKGGGSENKATFAMLNPSDSIVDWVLETVPEMGAGWCPPGMLGIGVGGTADKAMVLAKESLMDPIDMHELLERGPSNKLEELRIELYEKVNALGIGAQGLGGLTTVLDVKIRTFPDACGIETCRDDPELRSDTACAFRAGWQRARRTRSALARSLARRALETVGGVAARGSRPVDARGNRQLETRADVAAVWPDADGPRCRSQAARGAIERGQGPAIRAWI